MNIRIEQTKERLNYIDWLHMLAVLPLFIHSTGTILCSKYFFVKNDLVNDTATFIVTFMSQRHIHLFMLLAGIGTYYAMNFKSSKEYIR